LVAPDSFGDSLTAVEAAAAITAGWNRVRPEDQFVVAPQSDGGPGFVDVLASRLGERRYLQVCGPLTDDVRADWVLDPQSATAYLECAQACGLAALGGPPTPANSSPRLWRRAPPASSWAWAVPPAATAVGDWSRNSADWMSGTDGSPGWR